MKKKCIICGKEFERSEPNQICCSPECSIIRKQQKQAECQAEIRKWLRPVIVKKCAVCGKEFKARHSRYVCCSPECSAKRKSKQIQEWWKNNSELFIKKRKPCKCAFCGKEFLGRKKQKYCSKKCSDKMFRQRRSENVLPDTLT